MKGFKLHITLFFLCVFLFPQAANSVHYFVIPHSLGTPAGEEDVTTTAYDYHFCEYQLTGWSFFIPTSSKVNFTPFPTQGKKPHFLYSFNLISELAFHYSLRGPPHAPGLKEGLFIYKHKN